MMVEGVVVLDRDTVSLLMVSLLADGDKSKLLLSIPPPATVVVSLPYSSFWISPHRLLLSRSSPVHPAPQLQKQAAALGLSGTDAVHYITSQQAYERDERAAVRQAQKEKAER
ncbi:hypothetical protein E2C01_042937 [Portunus trituberculatus]|uniref:Uncharacterized protein n=1 Tax=Portunus trituberculatus TaxID=210409 RepID=A0A5B7FRJ8_PORTR|nr:hypothetical protein [Portunus trituberculatus]